MIVAHTVSGAIALSPPDDVLQAPPYPTKQAMELGHLQHFKRSIQRQFPDLQFELIKEGANPPDFTVSRDGTHFGLELTVFATPERRERSAFFSKFLDRLILVYSEGGLRGLSGMKIDVLFRDLGGKPFSISDDVFEQLVRSFDELSKLERPEISARFIDEGGATQWPNGNVGAIQWYVSGYSNQPLRGSKLSNCTGFEVECTHREWFTKEDIAKAISERISSKDRSGNDELLIVAGGPDLTGRMFPAEAMLVHHLLVNNPKLFSRRNHIRRVFLHLWGPDRTYVIDELGNLLLPPE